MRDVNNIDVRSIGPGVLTTGSTYNVTIAVQPAGHACVVANGTGIVQANTAASVTVTCS